MAIPTTNNSVGFAIVLEGKDDTVTQKTGERLRSLLQKGLAENKDPAHLIQKVKQAFRDDNSRFGLILRNTTQVWVAVRGGPQVLRWSPTDALAPLSPKQEPSRSPKWFIPRRPLDISEKDRLMVTSEALSHQITSNNLLYLHANEVGSLMEDVSDDYGVAWTGVEGNTETWTRPKPKIHKKGVSVLLNTQLEPKEAGFILGGVLLLGILSFMGLSAYWASQDAEEDKILAEPIANMYAPPLPPSPELIPAGLNEEAKEIVVVQEPSHAPPEVEENLEDAPLDQLLLAASENGRIARTFLLGEFRENLLELSKNAPLPPAELLPVSIRPFFLPEEGSTNEVLARQVEELIRAAIFLGKFDLLQDFEGQLTYREGDAHVRGWLGALSRSSKSRMVRQWAKLHLDGVQEKP